MASLNPFDLLGNDDNDDPSHLFAAAQKQKDAAKTAAATPQIPAMLPTKPVPPAQAVRESRNNSGPQRGGFSAGRGGRGRGGIAGRPYSYRDYGNVEENGFPGGGGQYREPGKISERGPRQPYRGGRRGGYANGEVGGASERPRQRVFERHSGTGRGYEVKREGAGRGNWGTPTDDVIAQGSVEVVNAEDNAPTPEKQMENVIPSSETENNDKEAAKEIEDKEMTLEEYEKIKEEKRKVLLSLKTEERKVDTKEFESMQLLSIRKGNEEIFIKLGSDKDSRKSKENGERDEKAKKPININEFLKASDGRRSYGGRGRGRGRSDRGSRGDFGGGGGNAAIYPSESVIEIADPRQFPTLSVK